MAHKNNFRHYLKKKLEDVNFEHDQFVKALNDTVAELNNDVIALMKADEIPYEKYKEMNSTMEHVFNLVIFFNTEIHKPRRRGNSVDVGDVVESVYSLLSADLKSKDKEINSMLSNQRKEIEENIQRTSDEWLQKYKELTTHLDNLEVEAQNNVQKLFTESLKSFEHQNNDKVQSSKSKISEISDGLQSLQEKWNTEKVVLSENNKKIYEEFTKKNEEISIRILELKTYTEKEVMELLQKQVLKINDNSIRIGNLESKCKAIDLSLSKLVDNFELGKKSIEVDNEEAEFSEDNLEEFYEEGPMVASANGNTDTLLQQHFDNPLSKQGWETVIDDFSDTETKNRFVCKERRNIRGRGGSSQNREEFQRYLPARFRKQFTST